MSQEQRNKVRAIVWGLAYAGEAEAFDVEKDAVRAARAGVRANISEQLKLTGKNASERYAILTAPATVQTLQNELESLQGKAKGSEATSKVAS